MKYTLIALLSVLTIGMCSCSSENHHGPRHHHPRMHHKHHQGVKKTKRKHHRPQGKHGHRPAAVTVEK